MSEYETKLSEWRQSKDDELRTENSWLALAGLFWLEEGENSFGSSPANQIVIPLASALPRMGTFHLENGAVRLRVADGVAVEVDGESTGEAVLDPDTSGSPSLVTVDDLALIVLDRGAAQGIRLWDNSRAQRETFPGRDWYPPQDAFRIQGTYEPFDHAQRQRLQRRNGADIEAPFSGTVHFSLAGEALSLLAAERTNGDLHIMFHDGTSGTETYGAGRYLLVDAPVNSAVWVDFNRAYNPPCAFTEFATCLLPPPQNRLSVSIAAGEKKPV